MAIAGIVSAVALKATTHKSYSTHWRTYILFCLVHSLDPLVLAPFDAIHHKSACTAEKVEVRFTRYALYLGCQRHHTRARHYSFTSVKDYVLGARRQLSLLLHINLASICADLFTLSNTLRGLKYTMEHVKRVRNPITPQHLLSFAKFLGMAPSLSGIMTNWRHPYTHRVTDKLYNAMMMCASLFAFNFLLRVSELTVSNQHRFDHLKELSWADVTTGIDADGHAFVSANIKSHKTDRQNSWRQKRVYACEGGILDLFSIVAHYRALASKHFGAPAHPSKTPFFRHPNGMGLTAAMLKAFLRRALTNQGFAGQNYAPHSLRMGGASALVACNAPETVVKLAAGWLSNDMPALYASLDAGSLRRFQVHVGKLTSLSLQDKGNAW